MKLIKYILFFFILFKFCTETLAQANDGEAVYLEESIPVENFDPESIEEARGDLNYADDYFKRKNKKRKNLDTDAEFGNVIAGIIKIVFIVLIIGILIAIIANMLSAGNLFKPKSKRIKGSVSDLDFKEIEDNLKDSDIENFLEKAIADKEYKVAVRLYFLMTIRDLSEQKMIKWKKDKTNRAYVRETGRFSFNSKFREVTNIFERIWYGDFNLTAGDFTVIQPKFKSLLQEIKNMNS